MRTRRQGNGFYEVIEFTPKYGSRDELAGHTAKVIASCKTEAEAQAKCDSYTFDTELSYEFYNPDGTDYAPVIRSKY